MREMEDKGKIRERERLKVYLKQRAGERKERDVKQNRKIVRKRKREGLEEGKRERQRRTSEKER